MPNKVKIDLSQATKDIKRFKSKSKGRAIKVLETEIIGSIKRGVSPVDGFGRFPKYSKSYIKQITIDKTGKRKSPVNLKLTGELLKSFFAKVTIRGVTIGFDNFLADIHNREGAGKSKVVRRMLPTNAGERFNRSIIRKLRESLTRVANEIFRG